MSSIYDDPVAYDLIHNGPKVSADIGFYLKQLEEKAISVLELGCGTGRVTIPLAQAGHSVTGIDIDEGMLARGREKARDAGVDIEWVLGDVRDFDLKKQFDAILFPINSICHLADFESIKACFECVKKHLSDTGVFIFQIFTPSLKVLSRDPNKRYPVSDYEDPVMGHVVITETNIYDHVKQINRITWYYESSKTGREVIKHIEMRMFFPQELDALLRYNGFEIVAKYGSYDGTPYEERPMLQIPVCRKRR